MVPVPNKPLARLAARAALPARSSRRSSSCASTVGSLRVARNAEAAQNYDVAVAEYTKLLRDNPEQPRGPAGARARQAARLAGSLHPRPPPGRHRQARRGAGRIPARRRAEPGQRRHRARAAGHAHAAARQGRVREDGKTRLESLIAQSLAAPLPGADLPADAKLPDSVIFRDASSRDIYSAIGKFTNLSVIFDPTFRDQPVSIDLRGKSLEEALTRCRRRRATSGARPAPRSIIVIPDTAAKRREYEEEIVRTFYLSNADLKETIDMLRIVVDARRIAPITATNAITIKDTPERITAAGKIITAIDKARPEVIIDVELLEVNRTHLHGVRSADRVAAASRRRPASTARPTSTGKACRCAACRT